MSNTEKYNLVLAMAIGFTSMLIGLMTLAWNASEVNSQVKTLVTNQSKLQITVQDHLLNQHKNDPLIIDGVKKNAEAISKLSIKTNFIKYDIKNYIDDAAMTIIKATNK